MSEVLDTEKPKARTRARMWQTTYHKRPRLAIAADWYRHVTRVETYRISRLAEQPAAGGERV